MKGVGTIVRTQGAMLLAKLPLARVGSGVRMARSDGSVLFGQVAGIERDGVAIAPFGHVRGVSLGNRVVLDDAALGCVLGFAALGRAIDASGAPLDGGAALLGERVRIDGHAPAPHERGGAGTIFWTGVRAIDALLSVARGARIGIFGAPGCGKSTLLETIAAGAAADAVVIALVGERGREATRWLARLDFRTTIVCATSDRSAAERVRAADVAMAQATALRARGLHVVLIVDSLARYVGAHRELRVALGEPVGRGGYPPAVFAELARFLERAGSAVSGSVTLLATVLSDGDDDREPLADAARAALDGHIVLSSRLAQSGHFPAIDVLASASRTMHEVVTAEVRWQAERVRAALALLEETRDARSLGLAAGNRALDRAVECEPALREFLVQREPADARTCVLALAEVAELLAA